MHQFYAGKRLRALKGSGIRIEVKKIIGLGSNILMCRNHKSKRPTGRVVAAFLRLRLHQAGHHVNQHARREILPCAGFLLVGVLLQKPFIEVAKPFLPGGKPVQPVNGSDDFFKVFRLVNIGARTLVDFPHTACTALTQVAQQFLIEFLQFNAAFGSQAVPAVGFGNLFFRTCFLRHFQKKDIRQLGYILVVGDAIITEDIAQIPEFRYDFLCCH